MELTIVQSTLLEVRDWVTYLVTRSTFKEYPEVVYGYKDELPSIGYKPRTFVYQMMPYTYVGLYVRRGSVDTQSFLTVALARMVDVTDIVLERGENHILALRTLRGVQVIVKMTATSAKDSDMLDCVHLETFLATRSIN